MSNPTDYIKREDVAKLVRTYCKDLVNRNKDSVEVTEFNADIQRKLAEIPATEVVEVVRCEECKHCDDMAMSGLWCNHPDNRNPLGCRPGDFCNDGKRKDDKDYDR